MTTATTSSLSEEEDNYLRLCKLVNGPGKDALRMFFESLFPPSSLITTLKHGEANVRKNAFEWRITKAQLDVMYPVTGMCSSADFDITLMVALIRNFLPTITNSTAVTHPFRGWDRLPVLGDVANGDDIVRIKFYRNEMAHRQNDILAKSDFKAMWNDLTGAVSRLSGTVLDSKCEQMETMRLDNVHEIRKEILEFRKDFLSQLEELRIPGRDAHETEVRGWEKEDVKFVKTYAVDVVESALRAKNCVVVTGTYGSGKSSIVHHASLGLRDKEGYEIIPIRDAIEITSYYQMNKRQIFVLDDLVGISYVMQSKLQSLEQHKEFIQRISKRNITKIIASSRMHIYQNVLCQSITKLFESAINLQNYPLTKDHKIEFLAKYIPSIDHIYMNKILTITNPETMDHFPLLCSLYAKHENDIREDIYTYFMNPWEIHRSILVDFSVKNRKLHIALLVFTLCNGKLSRREVVQDGILREHFVSILQECNYQEPTLWKNLEAVTGSYVKKIGDTYLPIHDAMLVMFFSHFSEYCQEIVIKHIDSGYLRVWAMFESVKQSKAILMPQTIIIRPENEGIFFQRAISDISKGKSFHVFNNMMMNSKDFRLKLKQYIENCPYRTMVRRAVNVRDEALGVLPIQIASFRGFTELVDTFLLYVVDINHFGIVGFSALHAACAAGNADVVQLLIRHGADVNKTVSLGHFVAAYIRTMEALGLPVKEAVPLEVFSTLAEFEVTPLWLACAYQHKSIVEILLQAGASINRDVVNIVLPKDVEDPKGMLKCFLDAIPSVGPGVPLLYLSIHNRNKDIFDILIQNGARIDYREVLKLTAEFLKRDMEDIEDTEDTKVKKTIVKDVSGFIIDIPLD